MSKLDALGRELRKELGAPPIEWEEAQRRRLRHHELRPRPRERRRWVAPLAVACALLGGTYIGFFRGDATVDDASQWLDASSSALPYVGPDGSQIQLDVGSRGRFSMDGEASQFDLHGGRATFEVAKRPNQDWKVVAGRYSLHVIGTRFVVAYEKDDLDVRVQEGRVAVHVPQRAQPVVLESGDHFTAKGDQLQLETQRSGNEVLLREGSTAGWANDGTASSAVSPNALPPNGISPNDVSPMDEHLGDPPHDDTKAKPTPGERAGLGSDWHALYVEGKYKDALLEANRAGFDGLTRRLNASKLLDLSNTARLGGDSQSALAALRALESRFPSAALSMDTDFLMGRLHAQRGETGEATRRLAKYIERGDGSRYAVEAMGRLVELYSKSGNQERARTLARRYLERAPSGPYHRLAESVLEQR